MAPEIEDRMTLYKTQLQVVLDVSTSEYTDLHKAVKMRRLRQIEDLLDKGAEVDVQTSYGITPLHVAASQGDVKIVELLLSRGASIKPECPKFPPLMLAVASMNKKLVELLVERGSDVNELVDQSFGYLHYWTRHDNLEMVKFLLTLKADINLLNSENENPLCVAVRYGRLKLIDYLLEKGALVNDILMRHNSALLQAVQMNDREVFQQMCWHALSFSDTDREGRNVLLIALKLGKYDYMRDMLEAGANPNAACEIGLTVLHHAVKENDTSAVQVLCEYRAEVLKRRVRVGPNLRNILVNEANWRDAALRDEMFSALDLAALFNNDCLEPLLLAINGLEELYRGSYIVNSFFHRPRVIQYYAKLKRANLPYYEAALRSLTPLDMRINVGQRRMNEYGREIAAMSERKMFRNVSYYDLLHSSKKDLTNYSRRQEVAAIFETKQHERLFPHYKYVLMWRYVIGRRYILFWEKAKSSLNTLLGGTCPDLIVEMILKSLDETDIRKIDRALRK